MPNERLIMDVNNSCRAFLAKLIFYLFFFGGFFFFLVWVGGGGVGGHALLLSDAALPPPGIYQKWRFVNMHSTFVGIYENSSLQFIYVC